MICLLLDVSRLVDRVFQRRQPTGVDRVGLAYVEYFKLRAQALVRFAGRWLVLSKPDSQRFFDWLLAPETGPSKRIRWLIGKAYASSWSRPRCGNILLNVSHSGLDRPGYVACVRQYGVRPFYFLHDLIPLSFSEYGRPGEAERHRRRLEAMLTTACGLIVNSEATGRELVNYATVYGYTVPPWMAVHLAPPAFPSPTTMRPIEKPYFVVLGTIEPRKNHLLLLHLWRQLAAELGDRTPHLVVIGQRGWECEQVVDMLERCTGVQGHVTELSNCDDQALTNWLVHAQALLFPSFAEGYGLPLVEALSLGTPVIASDLAVFRELAGDVPEYLNPLDGLGWRRAVLDYAKDDHPHRLAQKARIQRWQAPTWAAHFEKVEAFMQDCL